MTCHHHYFADGCDIKALVLTSARDHPEGSPTAESLATLGFEAADNFRVVIRITQTSPVPTSVEPFLTRGYRKEFGSTAADRAGAARIVAYVVVHCVAAVTLGLHVTCCTRRGLAMPNAPSRTW